MTFTFLLLPILVIAMFVLSVIFLVCLLAGGGRNGRKEEQVAEDLILMRKINDAFDRMEERIENLETALLQEKS